jgi:hypothetical protein
MSFRALLVQRLPSPFDETQSVDVLNLFNDASQAPASGQLTHRSGLTNSGYALTGLGMGDTLTLSPVVGRPSPTAAGSTTSISEIVELLLGKNKETMNIDATPANTVTVIHGGSNDDTFTVTGPVARVIAGPLVLYGDSAQNALLAGGVPALRASSASMPSSSIIPATIRSTARVPRRFSRSLAGQATTSSSVVLG